MHPFLLATAPIVAECAKTDFNALFSIGFGLFSALMTWLYFGERKKARVRAEGIIEGNRNAILDSVTSNQAVLLSKVDIILDTQNKNHLTMCERMIVVENDTKRNIKDINTLGGIVSSIGSDVQKIKDHIWVKPKGQYDDSDNPDKKVKKPRPVKG